MRYVKPKRMHLGNIQMNIGLLTPNGNMSFHFSLETAILRRLLLFFLWLYNPIQALATSVKLSVSIQLLDLGQSVGLLGQVISSSQGKHRKIHTKHKHWTSTPCVVFEPTVPAPARAKTVHALDRFATVTGKKVRYGKAKLSLYKPWRPLELREFGAPIFSLDIRLIDGGKVVSPTRRPLSTPTKIPGTHFC
jgi:hypothetical protein